MKKIILLMIVIASFTRCDLERKPYTALETSTIVEEPEASVDMLLNGMYSYLRNIYISKLHHGEYRGDNVRKDKATTSDMRDFLLFARIPSRGFVNTFWLEAYKVISQASEVTKLVKPGTSEELDSKIGEAYYLRGLMYFNLVRSFGRPYYQGAETYLGVPIVNGMPEGGLDGYQFPNRSTVKEVYQQITGDLRRAEAMCKPHNSNIRISKEAARAALAKAYIYMSGTFESPNTDFADSAHYYSDLVVENGKFQLLSRDDFMTSYELAPTSGIQKETIFAANYLFAEATLAGMGAQPGGMYARIENVGWGEISASSHAIELFNETGTNDWRKGREDNSGIVDARAAFVVPKYILKEEGKPSSYIRAFVVVVEQYDVISGKVSGYGYKQFYANTTDIALTEVHDTLFKGMPEQTIVTYALTAVGGDPKNRKYSIDYPKLDVDAAAKTTTPSTKKKTYTGYDDAYTKMNAGYPKYHNYRCSFQEGQSQLWSPVIARLSDIILIRAEASAKLGNYSAALTDLNKVRERAIINGSYLAGSLTAANAKERIMKERRLELIFHGDRVFDLFRTGQNLLRNFPGWVGDPTREILPTDNDVVLLIPDQQINAWGGPLTQNP